MPLISVPIPNLINGISQQPATVRLPTQAEAQENAYSSVVEGLSKFAPTEHIAKLTTGTLTLPFLHTINRDTSERYSVIATGLDVQVYDLLTGAQKTVNFEDVTDTCQNAAVATGNGTAFQIRQRTGVTTITLTTTGITTATVVWEKSSTGAFAGEETTVRTDTSDTSGTVSWTAGDYIRARISAWTSGTITATVVSKKANYLYHATNQRDNMRSLTIADNTFLTNTTVTTAMSSSVSTSFGEEYIIFIKTMPAAASTAAQTFTVDGTTVTPTFDNDQVDYAANIITAFNGNGTISAGFTYSRNRSTIRIKKNDGAAFALSSDNVNPDYTVVIKKKVQRFTDLPVVAPTGMVVEVVGDQTSAFDNYFVKFVPINGSSSFDTGLWEETVAEGIANEIDAQTMPHLLVRESDGTFTYKRATWSNREKGDDTANPVPSFIGNTINAIFFYRNRLGFLADTNAIMSQAGEFFNFFRTTVTTLLDGDRIDVAAAATSGSGVSVSILRHAVTFEEALLLFSDQGQFTLTGEDNLTAETVQIKLTTQFEANTQVPPVNAGRNLYFAANNGEYSILREYYVDGETGVNDAAEVTEHVPKYVPKDIVRIANSTTEGVLLALASGQTDRLYVYKYFWQGNEKLQSAWCHRIFAGATVLDVSIITSTAYVVLQYTDAVYLAKLDLSPGRVDNAVTPYLTHLDRRVDESDCSVITYTASTNRTRFTLPYNVASGATMKVVTRRVASEIMGRELQNVTTGTDWVEVDDDHSSTPVYIGERYVMSYTFSTPVLQEKQGRDSVKRPLIDGRLQLRTWTIAYDNTGFFTLKVTPDHTGVTSSYPFGPPLGTALATIGETPMASGTFRRPIMAKNDEVTITVENDSHFPCHLTSADWEGMFIIRSERA